MDGVQAVALGDAFELMLAGVGECEAASGDEVFDCLGDKHLGSAGQGCDTSAGGDRDSCAFSVYQFAFSGVCTPAQFDAEVADALLDVFGAVDGSGRAIEGGIEAVARGVVLHSAPGGKSLSDGVVVGLDQLLPVAIA